MLQCVLIFPESFIQTFHHPFLRFIVKQDQARHRYPTIKYQSSLTVDLTSQPEDLFAE